jgi:hypothetical protein
MRKCASTKNCSPPRRAVFFISPQSRATLQENARRYDGHASGGLLGGINTYAYVENNPLSYADPDGLQRIRPGSVGPIVPPRPIDPSEPNGPTTTPGFTWPKLLPDSWVDSIIESVRWREERLACYRACNAIRKACLLSSREERIWAGCVAAHATCIVGADRKLSHF